MFDINILASGSSGNCIHVDCSGTQLLFDAGVSGKYIQKSLSNIGSDAHTISGALFSHEHADHIRGAGIIHRKFNIPLYFTEKTYHAAKQTIGQVDTNILPENQIRFNDVKVELHKTSHDAADPHCFVIEHKNRRFGIITDLGFVSQKIKDILKDLDGVLLESNNDPYMLINGKYPPYLKKRIQSNHGHLSNYDAALAILECATPRLKSVFLGHLSKENNTPELAMRTFKDIIHQRQDLCRLDVRETFRNKPAETLKLMKL